ncbi:rhodanese-like domain-containing protein [Macrococcus capreoli]|uniref:sulfurtransferase n=1 Tax=Macrococcus capreoli TaxID=2982690 RepID=UPI0021D5DBB3|nr:rhodanese-like domain-containing protein [Macrococcus sp. TMW 2.2395]MCU7556725.1 rhodanese-like domain-containing protein [Macrococcus sp. TMW 2.2395]
MKIWITEAEALELVSQDKAVIFDCRGVMDNLEQSIQNFMDERIEGAEYIHSFLMGQNPLSGGRHPLPDLNDFAEIVESFAQGKQIIGYDNRNSFYGTRFVYLCHLVGLECLLIETGYEDMKLFNKSTDDPFKAKHHTTLVLYKCSVEEYKMAEKKIREKMHRNLNQSFDKNIIAFCDDIQALIKSPKDDVILIDARAHERYIGDVEPMDKIAGHIPSAINIPFSEVYYNGLPKNENDLREVFQTVLGKESIVYCGSGLSATPLYVALKTLDEKVKLYAGSYSEWVSRHPEIIETGE